MTITQIEYFVEVAATLSYSQAAENLHVSRQTIGKQVQALEKELDIVLFDRNNKRALQLTEAGAVLFPTWRELLDKNQAGIWLAREKSMQDKTILRLGIHETPFLLDFSVDLVKEFQKKHSDIFFRIETAGLSFLQEKLQNNELDLILILSSELEAWRKIYSCILCKASVKPCVIMSKDHPLAKKKNLLQKDLEGETYFTYSRKISRDAEKKLWEYLRIHGIKPSNVVYFDNTNAMEIALALGEGITTAFDVSFRNQDQLKMFPVTDMPNTDEDFVLCWNREKNRKYADQFAEILKDHS